MNKLAEELNNTLSDSVILSLLSDLGKELFFPKGLVAQTEEAKLHAHKLNATVGMAYDKNEVIFLPVIRKYIPELEPEEIFPYSGPAGDPVLRKLWKEEILKKNPGINCNISLPVATSGITHGLSTIAEIFAGFGDTLILPDMNWGNYKLIFETKKQCNIKYFPFFSENKKFNINGLIEVLDSNCKNNKLIIILNFPNNPTGYSPSEDEAEYIAEALKQQAEKGRKILAITDDSYFGLFYEKNIFNQSIFSKIANLHENILAVKLDGATKEYFAWGFRIGFITISSRNMKEKHYEAFEKKVLGSIRSTISNCSRLTQTLLIKALQSKIYQKQQAEAGGILKNKYIKVKKILSSIKIPETIKILPFNSGYFMCLEIKNKAEELRKKLLYEQGIGLISIEGNYLRIAFSKIDIDDMEELFSRIFKTAEEI